MSISPKQLLEAYPTLLESYSNASKSHGNVALKQPLFIKGYLEEHLSCNEIAKKYGLSIRIIQNSKHKYEELSGEKLPDVRSLRLMESSDCLQLNPESNKAMVKIELMEPLLREGKGRNELRSIFNMGHRPIDESFKYIRKHFPELVTVIHKKRSMKGKLFTRNPGALRSLEEVTDALESSKVTEDLMKTLNLSEDYLYQNIQYHNLEDEFIEFKDRLPFRSLVGTRADLKSLESIVPNLYNDLLKWESNPTELTAKLHKVHIHLLWLSLQVRKMGTIISKKDSIRKYSFTSNRGSCAVANLLLCTDVQFKMEYPLDAYFYDFYLPDHGLLIEVDGTAHKKGKLKGVTGNIDDDKKQVATNAGLVLLRIPFSEKGLFDEHQLIKDINAHAPR